MATATPPAPHDALGALLEESAPTSALSTPPAGVEFEDVGEPVPSLASLLLSTAQSLATRSQALNNASTVAPAPKAEPPPAFALVVNPSALLANPTSTEYLASLLALPLPTLLALPNQLSTLSTSLDTDLSSLAFTRYSSFLLAHTATQSISTSFSTISANLSSFIEATDALKSVVAGFEQRVSDPRRKRERMALVRERMEEVEELMEAPSVVDACVRAGYWTEAIDVAIRLSDLHKRLSRSASHSSADGEGVGALLLLERVREEVSVALLSLRARVLESLLQRELKLPGAVRGVSILRRIGERGFGMLDEGEASKEMDENALRIVFLAARWRCLRAELESVEGQMAASGIKLDEEGASRAGQQPDDPDAVVGAEENEERTRWTKRWIEVWREVVGETVGMYTEVFLSSTPPSSADHSNPPHALPPSAPLALFLTTSLNSLSDILAYAIPSLTSPSSLSSLLTQLSYCSHSFARHGLEFRELQQLRERVEARVGRIVVVEWEMAGRKWEKEWREGWEGSASSGSSAASRRNHLLGGRPPISDWLVSSEGLSQVLATPMPPAPDMKSPATWHHQPSQPLALLPPLARFLNAHATALNSLRLLPPLALYPSFLAAQARELDRATQVLAAFTDAWLASLSTLPPLDPSVPDEELSREERQSRQLREDERQLVIFAVAAFGRWVVPWCEGGLKKGVYGELGQRGLAREEREKGVVDAMRRVEGIIARIEGREVESSPVPTPTEEKAPPVLSPVNDVEPKLNGTSEEHVTLTPSSEKELDVLPPSPSSAEVAPIPFDPSPLDRDMVDPAIVEAAISTDAHVPEEEPPAVAVVEKEVVDEENTLDTTSPPPPSSSQDEIAHPPPVVDAIPPQLAPEADLAPVLAPPALEEEPAAADVEELVVVEPSSLVEEPTRTVVEPTQVEEDALEAPIEELDVDKMPLARPPSDVAEGASTQEAIRAEEPEVEISVDVEVPVVEEPAAEELAADEEVGGEKASEEDVPAMEGEEEGEEDSAWGI